MFFLRHLVRGWHNRYCHNLQCSGMCMWHIQHISFSLVQFILSSPPCFLVFIPVLSPVAQFRAMRERERWSRCAVFRHYHHPLQLLSEHHFSIWIAFSDFQSFYFLLPFYYLSVNVKKKKRNAMFCLEINCREELLVTGFELIWQSICVN